MGEKQHMDSREIGKHFDRITESMQSTDNSDLEWLFEEGVKLGIRTERKRIEKIRKAAEEPDNPNRDFTGRCLHVGDEVVFMEVGYRNLMRGKILSLSALKAKISHEPTNTSRTETVQFCDQIIRIDTDSRSK